LFCLVHLPGLPPVSSRCFHRLQSLKACQRFRVFLRWSWKPKAQVSPRGPVSLSLWVIIFDLPSACSPTGIYDFAGTAHSSQDHVITRSRKPHRQAKVKNEAGRRISFDPAAWRVGRYSGNQVGHSHHAFISCKRLGTFGGPKGGYRIGAPNRHSPDGLHPSVRALLG
jgi:hypothetical protein